MKPFCPAAAVAATFVSVAAGAVSLAIIPDGDFREWTSAALAHSDPAGDAGDSGIDFGRIYLANDAERLYVRFETGTEIKLQEYNDIVLYVDSDNDPATGRSVRGIGADLAWRFGAREGTVYHADGAPAGVTAWAALDFRQEPTVSGHDFELAFKRSVTVSRVSLFDGPELLLLFRDEYDDPGDVAPDTGAIEYKFDSTALPADSRVTIERDDAAHLRVLSHNVLRNGWFDDTRAQAFDRLYQAAAPDIFSFQEFGGVSSKEVERKVQSLFGNAWHSAQVADNVVVSKFPIVSRHAIGANLGVFIDLPDDLYATDLYLIDAHLPCCGDDFGRQFEIDVLLEWIRDLQTPGGAETLPKRTPIVVTGDMNLVGFRQQLDSLLRGDIQDESAFGPDHAPDWDDTPISDVFPRHVAGRDRFTWWDASSSFMPGRLDFILYTDSVLRIVKSYVLWTPEMPEAMLDAARLRRGDAPAASDHVPLVVDLKMAPRALRVSLRVSEFDSVLWRPR